MNNCLLSGALSKIKIGKQFRDMPVKNKTQYFFVAMVIDGNSGAYFQKFNPLLFAGLSLPQTKIRPKHNEGVVWSQNKGHFWTQHPWKPLYRLLVWPYLWIWIFLNFLFFGVICLIGGTTRDLPWVIVGNIRPWTANTIHPMHIVPPGPIGHADIGTLFLWIENSKCCLNSAQSNLIGCSTLSQEYCKLIIWYCKIMRRQFWKFTCPVHTN